MTGPVQPTTDREERWGDVLVEVLDARDRGGDTDPAAWQARYPEFAADLARFFDGQGRVDRYAAPLRGLGQAAEAPAPPTGTLGDFHLLRVVGRGGMGVVYEAEQISLGRRVAVKVLPFAGALDPKQLQRFKIEAQAAAHLHHTNIVPVHFVGCERGVHFYAMQFIDGTTLAGVIQELRQSAGLEKPAAPPADGAGPPGPSDALTGAYEPAPVAPAAEANTVPIAGLTTSGSARGREFFRTAARLGLEAAEALDHAHEQGVIHRDIKPSNLLVDAQGRLWITDFGLAQFQAGAQLTMTGDLIGTLRYMSPEQALAKRVVIDHRTDVYSLGVTLYELLILEPAFGGQDRQELLRQIAFEEPRPPRRLHKAIPADLETIVGKAMEKNPADRYATAAELAEDLRRWLAHETIKAKPPTVRQRLVKWMRRHRAAVLTAAGLLAALAVTLVAATAVSVWYALDARRARQEADARLESEQQARRDRQRADTATYLLRINQANRAWADNELLRARLLLDRCPAELRHWEWHYLHRLCHEDVQTLEVPERQAALSPDGRRLVTWDGQAVRVRDLPSGRETAAFPVTADRVDLFFGPEGPRVVSWHPGAAGRVAGGSPVGELRVWETATGRATALRAEDFGSLGAVTLTPDGRRLIAGCATPPGPNRQPAPAPAKLPVRVWDVATGREVLTLRGHTSFVTSIAVRPDGQRVTTVARACDPIFRRRWHITTDLKDGQAEVKVWDLATGRESYAVTLGEPGDPSGLVVSPDGQRAAQAARDQTVRVWDLDQPGQPRTLPGPATPITFSPDGRRLVTRSADGVLRVCDVTGADPAVRLAGDAGPTLSVTFSPDGRRVAAATTNNAVWAWDAADGREICRVRGHVRAASVLAFGPDEDSLVSYAADKTVRVWDLSAAPVPRTLPGAAPHIMGSNVAFDAAGRRLAHGYRAFSGIVSIWDAATGRETHRLAEPGPAVAMVLHVALSPDGSLLAARMLDGTIDLWDLATSRRTRTLRGQVGDATSIAFHPDGRLVSAGSDGTLRVWDAGTGREDRSFRADGSSFFYLAVSPDGTRLASVSRDVLVWDWATGQVVHTLRGHTDTVRGVAFSPDGRLLATASADWTVKVWDAAMGREVRTLRGHTGAATAVDFSADGRRLVSASEDGTVKVWDWDIGEEALSLTGLNGVCITHVAFSPDGRRLAGSSDVFGVTVWDATPVSARRGAAAPDRPE